MLPDSQMVPTSLTVQTAAHRYSSECKPSACLEASGLRGRSGGRPEQTAADGRWKQRHVSRPEPKGSRWSDPGTSRAAAHPRGVGRAPERGERLPAGARPETSRFAHPVAGSREALWGVSAPSGSRSNPIWKSGFQEDLLAARECRARLAHAFTVRFSGESVGVNFGKPLGADLQESRRRKIGSPDAGHSGWGARRHKSDGMPPKPRPNPAVVCAGVRL